MEDQTKLLWHRELARTPATHAWVLGLYRVGEQYPQTVLDYFPAQDAPFPWLAEQLTRHAADEARHTWLYTRAIRFLGFEPETLGEYSVFNAVIRKHTPVSWAIHKNDTLDEKQDKIASFLIHAHFLERRVARSLMYHQRACVLENSPQAVQEVVAEVAEDENRHVVQTLKAAQQLVSRTRLSELMGIHSAAEARADRDFSQARVRDFLDRFGRPSAMHVWFSICARYMKNRASYV